MLFSRQENVVDKYLRNHKIHLKCEFFITANPIKNVELLNTIHFLTHERKYLIHAAQICITIKTFIPTFPALCISICKFHVTLIT